MKVEDISVKDMIGMQWSLKGKFLNSCGMRYRQARPNELADVVNWTNRETLKMDAERFAMSSYATKAQRSKYVTE
jgi:hypothetical protein